MFSIVYGANHNIIRRTSHITHHTSHVTRHALHITRHTSHVTLRYRHQRRERPVLVPDKTHHVGAAAGQLYEGDAQHARHHTSHVTRHTSHVTRHTSNARCTM